MKHAYTRRPNANSKVQANMHTSRNNQCIPNMQCSNTWTMDTAHVCKSNTKSITTIIYIRKKERKKKKEKKRRKKRGVDGGGGGGGGVVYWKVWENKWVFNCDLNEEYVCGGWRKADNSRLRDPIG